MSVKLFLIFLCLKSYTSDGIPRVSFVICFTERDFELFSLLWNGSERNSESFLFRGTAGIPPETSNCSVYSVFRGKMFLSEIANPNPDGSLNALDLDQLKNFNPSSGSY